MKSKDLSGLLVIALIAVVFSIVLANLIFKSPHGRSSEVPDVPVVNANLPDIYNDPVYHSFLSHQALDPALTVQIGGSNNTNPFSGQ